MTEDTMIGDHEIRYLNDDNETVAIVDDKDPFILEDGEWEAVEYDDELLLFNDEEQHLIEYDEDGWLIGSQELSDGAIEKLNDVRSRYAEADVRGYPIELKVSYRSDDALYDSLWDQEKLRPSSSLAQDVDGAIKSAKLTIEIARDGSITVTDLNVWPTHTDVTIDLS